MIGRFLMWLGGVVMWLVDRRATGARRKDVIIDRDWEEMKERAKRKPAE